MLNMARQPIAVLRGRKLAVDFYGGNCRIGGGSPWTKDPSKADLSLNLAARYLALDALITQELPCVYVSISCKIGSSDVIITYYNQNFNVIDSDHSDLTPELIISSLKLKTPGLYKTLCKNGLFSELNYKFKFINNL